MKNRQPSSRGLGPYRSLPKRPLMRIVLIVEDLGEVPFATGLRVLLNKVECAGVIESVYVY